MREFIHEFIGHYVALEGPLWRSLWAMVFLPGRLTLEYFRGRRRRFVQPLRLYLSMSFLFFIAWHLLPNDLNVHTRHNSPPAAQTQQGGCERADSDCNWFEWRMDVAGKKLSGQAGAQLMPRVEKLAPYALLLMQPVFAAVLALIFFRRRMKYAEHFVFALHLQAFWFLAILIGSLPAVPALLVGALTVLHALLALRSVYRVGWWGAVGRAWLAALLYLPLLALGMATLFVVTLITLG